MRTYLLIVIPLLVLGCGFARHMMRLNEEIQYIEAEKARVNGELKLATDEDKPALVEELKFLETKKAEAYAELEKVRKEEEQVGGGFEGVFTLLVTLLGFPMLAGLGKAGRVLLSK